MRFLSVFDKIIFQSDPEELYRALGIATALGSFFVLFYESY